MSSFNEGGGRIASHDELMVAFVVVGFALCSHFTIDPRIYLANDV
jgi:hypothetical protein